MKENFKRTVKGYFIWIWNNAFFVGIPMAAKGMCFFRLRFYNIADKTPNLKIRIVKNMRQKGNRL